MEFVLSDDQRALQQELRRLLTARAAPEARSAAVDRGLWAELGSMGAFALALPDEDGGVGLGLAEATVVFEELGRALLTGPVVATFLAAGRVPGAAEGATVVGLVPAGEPALVEHLGDLDVLLVDQGDQVVALDAVPPGRPVDRSLDPLTPVSVVDELGSGAPVASGPWAREVGGLLCAALQVGLGQAALDLAVAYAKEREQFGRPIGAFQAVKHLLADAAVAVEVARAGVHAAAVLSDEGTAPARAVPGARLVASRAAERATRTCIQVHGGMGYTWELDAHLYLKRSLVLDQAFGGVEGAVEAVAAAL